MASYLVEGVVYGLSLTGAAFLLIGLGCIVLLMWFKYKEAARRERKAAEARERAKDLPQMDDMNG